MIAFLQQAGPYGYLAITSTLLVWTSTLFRIVWPEAEYKSTGVGAWVVMAAVLMMTLANATLVDTHAPILPTIHAGLTPVIFCLMGMWGLLLLDGIAQVRRFPPQQQPHWSRWGNALLLVGATGLIMELRTALSVHMGENIEASRALIQATDRWFQISRNASILAGLWGLILMVTGMLSAANLPPRPPTAR